MAEDRAFFAHWSSKYSYKRLITEIFWNKELLLLSRALPLLTLAGLSVVKERGEQRRVRCPALYLGLLKILSQVVYQPGGTVLLRDSAIFLKGFTADGL
jgi:hypothetical protein